MDLRLLPPVSSFFFCFFFSPVIFVTSPAGAMFRFVVHGHNNYVLTTEIDFIFSRLFNNTIGGTTGAGSDIYMLLCDPLIRLLVNDSQQGRFTGVT